MKDTIKGRISRLNSKQKNRLRYALIMSLICVVLLSGATYAWFTIANNAAVNNINLQVVSDGKLYISSKDDFSTNKKTAIEFDDSLNKTLYPCTTRNGKDMIKPVYTASDTVGRAVAIADKEKASYYYETDVWLYVDEVLADGAVQNDYDITLGKNDATNTGTYIKADSGNSNHPEYCIRFSFEYDGKVSIYEPNSNGSNVGREGTDYAYDNTGVLLNSDVKVHKQKSDGNFDETETPYYEGDSTALFTIKGNTPSKVKIKIWFEGTDKDCMNEIQAQKIVGQLKFVSHRKEN